MSDPHEIWQLGQWIARRESGAARLGWSQGELILRLHNGRIRFVEGIDHLELARRLSCEPIGNVDLLEEARALARDRQIAETFAMGAAKELLQGKLREWFIDPARELEVVEGEPDDVAGATISITHSLVELVLSDTSCEIASSILPDLDVLLSRSPDFLDLYAPLRLSEEADLIVSKISGERTAREVADRANHGVDEVHRLLAGLVVTGILEPEPSLVVDGDVDLLPAEDFNPTPRKRIPTMWIVGTAIVLVLALAVIAWMTKKSDDTPQTTAVESIDSSGPGWGLVIDMGCEPQDLQRVLKKAQQKPKVLKPVAADSGDGDPCWRLVWGHFSDRDAAQAAIDEIPSDLRQQGFDPHPIEMTAEDLDQPYPAGG